METPVSGIRIRLSDPADRGLALRIARILTRDAGLTGPEEEVVLLQVGCLVAFGARYGDGCGEIRIGRDGSGGVSVVYSAPGARKPARFDPAEYLDPIH